MSRSKWMRTELDECDTTQGVVDKTGAKMNGCVYCVWFF